MSSAVVFFPSDIETLGRMQRLESLRRSYLFAGFDRNLCVFLSARHGERREHQVDQDFRYLELGLRRWPKAGRAGALAALAPIVAELVRESRRFGAEAVLAYDPHLLGALGLLTARLMRLPLAIRIICNYGLKFAHTGQLSFAPFGSRSVELAVERWLYRHAEAVMVACPDHGDYVRSAAGPGARLAAFIAAQAGIFYQPPERDPSVLEALAPGARRVVVSVGRLVPEKYPLDLIELARALDDPDTALLVIGDGRLLPEMKRAAAGLRTRVVFAGVQPQDRVRAAFATADATVVLQGGGALVEAALSGAPILSYDFEMNPFVIRPGCDEGVLVPFRDPAALAEAARKLLADPTRARRLGRRVQAAVSRRFSEEAARAAERAVAERLRERRPVALDLRTWQLDYDAERADENRGRHTAA